jgi:hypothetical protein
LANVSGKVYKDKSGRYFLVAAEQARSLKSKRKGASITSPEGYLNNLYESALNTKYVPGIILYLNPSDAEKFARFGGKMVTVRGTCKGMTADDTTEPSYFVRIENVRLVAASEPR